ncbi:MAG: Uncharacterised protein [Gammaproteobacteria bacterium]|nr:MAG: Uncharacterised protein [Gammaproteobacteria bacterium]
MNILFKLSFQKNYFAQSGRFMHQILNHSSVVFVELDSGL